MVRRYDSIRAETAFINKLTEQGATLLEPKWLGSNKPHRIRCAKGHISFPWPKSIQQGQGICKVCAGKDSIYAYESFNNRLIELGAELLESKWLGSNIPHKVRCVIGHICYPRPDNIKHQNGICRACAGQDPIYAEISFKNRLTELGAELLESKWLGASIPHRIRCINNHISSPRPDNIKLGGGVCRYCSNRIWDIFYIVSDISGNIKFGITSRNPQARLQDHKYDGFINVLIMLENLPHGLAQTMERESKDRLKLIGIKPIRGNEYYPSEALPYVLDVIKRKS